LLQPRRFHITLRLGHMGKANGTPCTIAATPTFSDSKGGMGSRTVSHTLWAISVSRL
jgi:hypothetical protein